MLVELRKKVWYNKMYINNFNNIIKGNNYYNYFLRNVIIYNNWNLLIINFVNKDIFINNYDWDYI